MTNDEKLRETIQILTQCTTGQLYRGSKQTRLFWSEKEPGVFVSDHKYCDSVVLQNIHGNTFILRSYNSVLCMADQATNPEFYTDLANLYDVIIKNLNEYRENKKQEQISALYATLLPLTQNHD